MTPSGSVTWLNFARWSLALQHPEKNWTWEEADRNVKANRMAILNQIGVINVKKVGGGASAHWEEIQKYCVDNSDLILRQIELYDPTHIVICGFPAEWIQGMVAAEWRRSRWSIPFQSFGQRATIIQFWHPQARFYNPLMFAGMMDVAQTVRFIKEAAR